MKYFIAYSDCNLLLTYDENIADRALSTISNLDGANAMGNIVNETDEYSQSPGRK